MTEARFSVLGLADAAAWSALIERLAPHQRDIHFLPQYGDIYRRTYGFTPFLAVYEMGDDFVLQPFVKRPLGSLPFLREQALIEPYHDVANPYGYGGPLVHARAAALAPELLRQFDRQLRQFLVAEQIASEFTSLHPLLGNEAPLRAAATVELVAQKDVVYIDLSLSEAELWQQTRKGHKSSIKKAIKSGVRIDAVTHDVDYEVFGRLYYATMERQQAAARWFVPPDYFRHCQEALGGARVTFFFARHAQTIVSACLVMHAFDTAYYHFSGADRAFFALCPNNLMVHEVALWAKRNGYRRFHLGGGVSSSPDDPLFVFKSGFAHRLARLYSYGRVHDRDAYDRLCRLKERHEQATAGQVSASTYFPLYRR